MTEWSGHGVLQVAVPELEDWISARTRHYDPRYLSSDPRFAHAHITVLAPLRPDEVDLAAIARIAATTRPFEFALREIHVFPNGCVYLKPDPDEPFRELTRRAWQAHPAVTPNGAPNPQPHLTLDLLSAAVTVPSTRASLGDLMPAQGRAEALELVWYAPSECRLIDRWPMGSDFRER